VDAILMSDSHGQTTLRTIVPLYLSRDRLALETHFAALDSEDLRYRFCASIKPAGVIHYLDRLTAAHSYGIFDSSRALVAVCQLAQSAGDLEVGISVLTPFRRKGFAVALLEHSIRYARARGLKALTIHSLADNTSMLSLARRIGMDVEILEGEADGRLKLCAYTISGERLRTTSRALRPLRRSGRWARNWLSGRGALMAKSKSIRYVLSAAASTIAWPPSCEHTICDD
jgi:GNAT superfamily N-acetyltransferase